MRIELWTVAPFSTAFCICLRGTYLAWDDLLMSVHETDLSRRWHVRPSASVVRVYLY